MSHTIIKQLRDTSAKNSFLDFTTVWNHHSIKSWSALIKNKRSNLFMMINSVLSDNDKKNGVTVVMGAAGRSQHSASEVVIFRCDQSEKIGGVYYSRKELTELGVA